MPRKAPLGAHDDAMPYRLRDVASQADLGIFGSEQEAMDAAPPGTEWRRTQNAYWSGWRPGAVTYSSPDFVTMDTWVPPNGE